jgi:uracil-DNA glycosylase family 4
MLQNKQNKYSEFKDKIKNCKLCEEKFGFEPRPFIWGSSKAKIVQISQAPSKTVHENGKPFSDLSGKKLREWYKLSEDDFYNQSLIYMTAMSHCYPGKDKRGQDVKPDFDCARKWLQEELYLINNEIYIIIGRIPTSFLFPKKDFSELIFNKQTLNNKPAYILPHPSPQNIKWFKDHPEFYDKILPNIRFVIKEKLKKT